MFDWIPQIISALLGIAVMATGDTSRAADVSASSWCPKPGTVITTSKGGEVTAKSSDGMFCMLGSKGAKDFTIYGLLIATDKPTDDQKAAISSLWPLAVGKSAKYIDREGRASHSQHWSVDRKETITTKAGTFDTFVVIDHEETVGTTNGFRGDYTFYLSQDLGYIAKFDFKMDSGSPSGAPQGWEVTKVTAKD